MGVSGLTAFGPAGSFLPDRPDGSRQRFGDYEGGPNFGTAIVTGPDLRTEDILFRLLAPSALHGRIVDQNGEPIESVMVQLFRTTIVWGRRTTYYSGYRNTNDLGEYRFGPLPPATYYLLVTGRPWYTASTQGDDALALLTYLPVFYPATSDGRAASPIRLAPGSDFAADLTLITQPASRLTIAIATPEDRIPKMPRSAETMARPPVTFARIDVRMEGPDGAIGWERVVNSSTRAELDGIPPGPYRIRVSANDPAKPLYAEESVKVAPGDNALEITLSPPPAVTGKLRMEGLDSAVPRGTYVALDNTSENRYIRRAVAADGSFQFDNLPPGQYMPVLASSANALRLRGIAVNGVQVTDVWIDIHQPAQLELTAVAVAGNISGLVYLGDEPQGSVLVLMVPKEKPLNPYGYQAYQTDSDGSFDFTGVTSGDYLLFAVRNGADFEYANPAVVKPFLAAATSVHLEMHQSANIRLDLK